MHRSRSGCTPLHNIKGGVEKGWDCTRHAPPVQDFVRQPYGTVSLDSRVLVLLMMSCLSCCDSADVVMIAQCTMHVH